MPSKKEKQHPEAVNSEGLGTNLARKSPSPSITGSPEYSEGYTTLQDSEKDNNNYYPPSPTETFKHSQD